jgi:hypothetical protein
MEEIINANDEPSAATAKWSSRRVVGSGKRQVKQSISIMDAF